MKKWSLSDKLTFLGFIIGFLTLIWGVYQYKDSQEKENNKLKFDENELQRYWNAKYDFSMKVPTAWVLHPQADARDGFRITHPYEDIEIVASGTHVDDELFELANNKYDEFLYSDFEGTTTMESIKSLKNFQIINRQRVKKDISSKIGKNWIHQPIPALWLVYRYKDEVNNTEKVAISLVQAGTGIGEFDQALIEATISCPEKFYESNKDNFAKILLSLEFGRGKN